MTIPSTLGGYPVTEIGRETFADKHNVTSVQIPSGVTTIGSMAFGNCTSLRSVTIPESVTNIEVGGAFGATPLFDDPSNRVDGVLYIDNCLIDAGDDAVSGSYTIREGTRLIAGYAFSGCTNMTSVTIPDSVANIGQYAFEVRSGLKSINVSAGNPAYTSVDGILFNKSKTELIQYPTDKVDLDSYTIPSSVTSIGSSAFAGCTSLKRVTIPDSVIHIGSDVFYETGVSDDASNWTDGALYVDNCLIDTDDNMVSGSFTIREGTRLIADWALSYCNYLTDVTIPAGVAYIGNGVFDFSSVGRIIFAGKAPVFSESTFGSPYGGFYDVYYPSNSSTWTEEMRQNYGGHPTWVGYESEFVEEEPVAYEILDGQNTVWSAEEGGALIVRSGADFSKFVEVRLDGETLDPVNYEVEKGSTIVTVKEEYLATLGAGEHTLEIVSTDGAVTASFTVTENMQGVEGDIATQAGAVTLWIVLAILVAAGAIALVIVYRKKHRA